MENAKLIYTLGTSNRSIDEFLAILQEYSIKKVFDVRRFPKSTRYCHFNRESLSRTLEQAGYSYLWVGELLGGYRRGGYEKYRTRPEYGRGLAQIEKIAVDMLSVLVCAEKLPWKCHRLQIAQDLINTGWKVIHIIEKNKTWRPVWAQ